MAVLVKVSKKSPTLEHVDPKGRVFRYEELKTIVGGSGLPECRFIFNEEICFVVCHRAKEKALPLNLTASIFYQLLADAPGDEYLYGDVLVCKSNEMM